MSQGQSGGLVYITAGVRIQLQLHPGNNTNPSPSILPLPYAQCSSRYSCHGSEQQNTLALVAHVTLSQHWSYG
ncbi:hypothetical protein DPEC_G00035400 [Dallia pectoralis]|uniref:Uncharacterized protein n=1 Tax=Dallia pectoralis TaxID=75939 RepID=A0ACC2HDQ4_DALPE|nr:hypothetical protein DPEC_G00035400 [Dallia pectoralis]